MERDGGEEAKEKEEEKEGWRKEATVKTYEVNLTQEDVTKDCHVRTDGTALEEQ